MANKKITITIEVTVNSERARRAMKKGLDLGLIQEEVQDQLLNSCDAMLCDEESDSSPFEAVKNIVIKVDGKKCT